MSVHDEWVARRVALLRDRVPAPYRQASLDPKSAAAGWCTGVLNGDPSNLLLQGTVGTGKTHTAYAAYIHLVSLGWHGTFIGITEARYLQALLPEGDRSLAVAADAADVLLLDDIGSAVPSDWSRSRLDMLLDDRWLSARPLIVTTNLPQAKLAAHLGPRAVSRLRHHLVTVPVTGADRRTS